jgi:hypothetical protein
MIDGGIVDGITDGIQVAVTDDGTVGTVTGFNVDGAIDDGT